MLTLTEKDRILATIEHLKLYVETLPAGTPCDKCHHWDDGHCAHWGQTVPEQFLENGCGEWSERVPF